MDELIKLVVEKTGISDQQAKMAVDTVLTFLKQKLPAPVGLQIDGFLSGNQASDVIKGLGNLLGGKK